MTQHLLCLIQQTQCARQAGNPVCPKCGMDERVVYPSQADLEAAQEAAQQRFDAEPDQAAVAAIWIRLHEQDATTRVADLERLALAGLRDAAKLLGDVYQHGLFGAPANRTKAREWYVMAAEAGQVGAMIALADLHNARGGVEGPRDFAQILHWLERADTAGSACGAYSLALWHACLAYLPNSKINERWRDPNWAGDEENNRERASNDAAAQVCLNRCTDRLKAGDTVSAADRFDTLLGAVPWLLFGKPSLRQFKLAQDILQQADKQDWMGQANAELKAQGWRGYGDRERCIQGAFSWYCQLVDKGWLGNADKEKASAQERWNHSEMAMVAEHLFGLGQGMSWYTNEGLPRDLELSFVLTHLCASLGWKEAQRALARKLTAADGAPRDVRRAAQLYDSLVADGDLDACLELGLLLDSGKWLPANPVRARMLIDRYAAGCDPKRVADNLINYYLIQDPAKAVNFLRQCGEHSGHLYQRRSLIHLSLMQAAGVGMPADLPAAVNRLETLYRQCDASNVEFYRQEVQGALSLGYCYPFDVPVDTANLRLACKQLEPVLRKELFPEPSPEVAPATPQTDAASAAEAVEEAVAMPSLSDLQRQAEAGESDAMQALGWRHVRGEGVPANKQLGDYWLRKYCDAPDSFKELYGELVATPEALLEGSARRTLQVARQYLWLRALDSAVTWLDHASRRGIHGASLTLAIMRSEGWGCASNTTEAAHLFALSITQAGLANADEAFLREDGCFNVLVIGEWAAGSREELKVSSRTALLGLKALAQAGSWKAQHMLGEVFREGLPGSEEPLWILQRRVRPDSEPPLQPDYTEALFWFQQAANQGYAEAMLDLAKAFLAGQGTSPDATAAARWGTAAAEAGLASAQVWIGQQCLQATGALDPKKAEGWFELAFQQSPSRAAFVGQAYATSATAANQQQRSAAAVRWWTLGAEAGDKSCMRHLASSFINGFGVPVDEGAADRWLERMLGPAQDDHDWKSRAHDLATDFLLGRGLPKRPDKGVYWLRRAADVEDYPHATFQLGLAYATGCGVPVNMAAAEECWQRCARLNWGVSSAAEELLTLHWVLWRRDEKYAEAYPAFEANRGDMWGLGEVGIRWLILLGYYKTDYPGAYSYGNALESGFHWAHELAAEEAIAKRVSNRTLALARSHLEEALKLISHTRESRGWFVGEAEEIRIRARLKAIQAMKPQGLGRIFN